MNEYDFEGSLVLERLAERELLDNFWQAIDADDFRNAASLMRSAGIDEATIDTVLEKMQDPGDDD